MESRRQKGREKKRQKPRETARKREAGLRGWVGGKLTPDMGRDSLRWHQTP